jgi:signal transduction histidine kinase
MFPHSIGWWLHLRRAKPGCIILLSLLAACPAPALTKGLSIRSLKSEIRQLESEITPLPHLLLNPSPWTLGYRSDWITDQHQTHTIDLWFNTPAPIDLIALLPATYSPSSTEVEPFGFPERFTIERIMRDGSSALIVDYSQQDYIVSGIEPQLFQLAEPALADGLRITILRHAENPTWWKTEFITALSEIMVFSGDWNVALGAEVEASSDHPFGYVWTRHGLVDGFSLFSPVSGDLQSPFENFYWFSQELILDFDLGENHGIDELRLWPVVHSRQHNFPQSSGIDFPMQIRFERLNAPNDATGKLIYTNGGNPMRPGSSPLMLRLPGVQGRYFRLTLQEPVSDFRAKESPQIALSEIEIVELGEVLTRDRSPMIKGQKGTKDKRSLATRLTDGYTTEGEILPLRSWIEGLNRRAGLERNLARMKLDLSFAQRQERERLFTITLLTLCITPILIWLAKLVADRRWKRTRDRIACDLHDEIGANVSSLFHMTELIKETIHEPTAVQNQMLKEAIKTARMTSNETRNFIQLLEADKSGFDLNVQIDKVARQILGNLDYRCEIKPDVTLSRLRISRQWDLLFFLKEALNNIMKHADATHVDILIQREAGRIQLYIADNGKGIPAEQCPPRHLKARAKQLKADLSVANLHDQGTRIVLNLK